MRAADDFQDIGRRGLPFERSFRLVEEVRISQRDHRLPCEAREELQVTLVEQLTTGAPDGHRAFHRTIGDEGNHHQPFIMLARGAGNLHAARIGFGVVDELRLAALHDVADDSHAALDHHRFDGLGHVADGRRSRGRSWFPDPERRSRCCPPAAGPSHGR